MNEPAAPRGWMTGAWPSLVGVAAGVAALVLAALFATGAPATTLRFDAGSPGDDASMSGFFPAERNTAETYRWSESDASLRVPVAGDGPVEVALALASAGGVARELRVACGGAPSTFVAPPDGQFSVTLTCRPSGGTLDLTLAIEPVRIPADGRPLGVALREVEVRAQAGGDRAAWRLRAALTAGALVAGLAAAGAALGGRRLQLVAAAAATALLLAVTLAESAALLPLLRGPAGPLALAAGLATLALRGGARERAALLAALGALVLVVLPQPPLVETVPGRWTAGDPDALAIVPWLALGALAGAVLLGGSRARWLAATAAALAGASAALPLVARVLAARWSATLAVPDWQDEVSVAGGLLVALVVLSGVVATLVAARARLAGPLATAVCVTLVLGPLVAWRDARVLLNGDEPHYYVTARSLAEDRDLELLDDYLEPSYRRETISPDGNIALRRDIAVDRAASWTPAVPGRWLLVPPLDTGLRASGPAGVQPAGGEPVVVTGGDGDREGLPALEAAPAIGIALPGSCNPRWLVVGSPDGAGIDVRVAVRSAEGTEIVSERLRASAPVAALPLEVPAGSCDDGGAIAIWIESAAGPVVAQAIDLRFGLRIMPARLPRDLLVLATLPRDNVATVAALAQVALFNPSDGVVPVTLAARGSAGSARLATRVRVEPGTARVVRFPLPATGAVVVEAPEGIVVGGSGSLASGTWALVEPRPAASWQISVPAAHDRDAGVWLSLAAGDEPARVVIRDAGERVIELCAGCADIVGLRGEETARVVDIAVGSGEPRLAALAYEERTGTLHFDPGLPVALALPARLAGPSAAFAVVAAFAVALAAGLWHALRRAGVGPRAAIAGAVASVTLAPVSPFAVRLYTEVPAACLIVWSLVAWDAGRRDRRWLAASAALALVLPFVHGRYLPATLVLLALVALRLPWRRPRPAVLAGGALGALVLLAAGQFAIGLRERVTLDYLDPAWLPHSLAGTLLDRGSGLLPVAPWLLLALAARRLRPLQLAALAVAAAQALAVLLRDGGWQTWGPPGRYLLASAVLLAPLAVPGALRLWRSRAGRAAVCAAVGWSIAASALLHWVPLAGYVSDDAWLVDGLPFTRWTPFALFPELRPATSDPVVGALLLLALLVLPLPACWRVGARYLRLART